MPYEGILDTNLFIRYLHDGTPEEKEKFGDALVLATAKVKVIAPVYTFDEDFEKFEEAEVL